ncbi:hypothetical protein ACX1NX_04410 [Acinetobacter sp. ANC 5383]
MKKLLISLVLSSSTLFVAPVTLANTAFSSAQMAQIQVPSLSFKDIMRELYNGQLTRAFLNDEEITKIPHVGLGQPNKDKESTVALMHPVIPYKNNTQEQRYLVIIEKIKVTDEGSVVSCHACAATADLYSFKKLPTGNFQLVSRSQKNTEFSSSYGRVSLSNDEIFNNIQPLGKNLIGSIFKNGYSNQGVVETWWEALHLPEDDFINIYTIADAGSENEGEYEADSPLSYSYEGKLQVIKDNTDYYPIKITYVGDKPTANYERIKKVNYSQTVNFDPIKHAYK